MLFKEARAEGRKFSKGYAYLTLSEQKEMGWYPEEEATQRTVYIVYRSGEIELYNSDFAKKYQERRNKLKAKIAQ